MEQFDSSEEEVKEKNKRNCPVLCLDYESLSLSKLFRNGSDL